MSFRKSLLLAIGVSTSCALWAHEGGGPEPADEKAAVLADSAETASMKPHFLEDGRLYVPKAVQRALGLRTELLAAAPASSMLLAGEVVVDPNAAGSIAAAQAGTLEAPARGWPLPGRGVESGEVLAYLRPQMSQREQARRRAALAQIDNDMQISEINFARLKLQADANADAEISGNVYYEQARLDYESVREKYRLETEALNTRVPVLASISGVLLTAAARPGDVVLEGQPLFEVNDPMHLRIALQSFDPTLTERVRSAQIIDDDAATIALTLRGQEPLAGRQGWRLLFDARPPFKSRLTPGQIVKISLQVATDARQKLAAACVAGTGGDASAWVHVAPEQFERRSLPNCVLAAVDSGSASTIAAGERVVTQGAALLSGYH